MSLLSFMIWVNSGTEGTCSQNQVFGHVFGHPVLTLYIYIYIYIYTHTHTIYLLFLAVLGLHCCVGSFLLVVRGLLIAVASRCEAQALGTWAFSGCGTQAQWLWAHGLSCSMAYGIFPHQGSNPCFLYWQVDSLPLSHLGSPNIDFC